ncbi:uncharacterized protein DUF1992 [Pseudomonas duriflava]|uniref:Uncharacterized protein DUF1992 n=1 Tax=Pseudomonas duriflava TaxID=459528 RepID=A0A562QFZ8_9PSED|nr:DUF1992 domain-containing protein [Pseudomonas duriflava]TWI55668.1 uncharacterized protein DUF1992 [Pseudomonas duriflava]
MSTLEQEIERRIAREVEAWQKQVTGKGEPLKIDEGWLQTPEGLRMPFRVLKNAGIPPREIDLFHQRAQLKANIEAEQDSATRKQLQQKLSELEQQIAFRLEKLRQLGKG